MEIHLEFINKASDLVSSDEGSDDGNDDFTFKEKRQRLLPVTSK
jgi:hypothetical protein